LSSAKDQQIVVVCDSASIATCDISVVLSSLKSLSGDRSSAMGAEGVAGVVNPPKNGREKRANRFHFLYHHHPAAPSQRAMFNGMCLNGQKIACREKPLDLSSKHEWCLLSAHLQEYAGFDPR
jgi:hypothetical protein